MHQIFIAGIDGKRGLDWRFSETMARCGHIAFTLFYSRQQTSDPKKCYCDIRHVIMQEDMASRDFFGSLPD